MLVVVVLSTVTIRKGLCGPWIQDPFGIDESVLFVGRSGVERVLFGIPMNAVRLEDSGGPGSSERPEQFEEGVLT